MFRYIGLAVPIVASMSGGAVVREQTDHVIAVMSNVLAQDNNEQPGENYANLLQSATDIGLNAISPCPPAVPDGLDIRQAKSQKEFMSGTCEGTLAWIPDGPSSEHWIFAQSGNYSLRRQDFPACKLGAGWKDVHVVLNSSSAGICENRPSSLISANTQTFYGVQLVPVFRDGTENTVDQKTWLYRNASLFSRRTNGAFFTPSERNPVNPQVADAIPPSKFNDVMNVAGATLGGSTAGCRSISAEACSDIVAVNAFTRALKLRQSWHGFVRRTPNAESTLKVAQQYWTVRDGWLRKGFDPKGNDIQLKNWILRYRATTSQQSSNPVDFDFCIQPEWTGFYLRTFSPERGVEPELIHVYLSD
jgi:type II secretory pathway pseudopilin PulG